jgi:hypothetical protein
VDESFDSIVGGSKSSFAFMVLHEEDKQPQPPPKENITIPKDLKLPWRIYGDQKELCREDVTKAFALLKTKAPSWYVYVMRFTESVSCNSSDTQSFTNLITAWYTVPVLPYGQFLKDYSDIFPYAIAGIAVHESCHINQFYDRLRLYWWSRWDVEIECSLMEIEAWKQIGAPQWMVDAKQDAIDRRQPWW